MNRKNQKNKDFFLTSTQVSGILSNIGCGSLMHAAGVASVNGGDSQNYSFTGSVCIEPVGRYFCTAVSACTDFHPDRLFFCTRCGSLGERAVKTLHAGGSYALFLLSLGKFIAHDVFASRFIRTQFAAMA